MKFILEFFILMDDKHIYLQDNVHIFEEMSIDILPSANIITKKSSKNRMLTK